MSYLLETVKAARQDGILLQVEPSVQPGKLVIQRVRPNYCACHPDDLERYIQTCHAGGFDVYVIDLALGISEWRLRPGSLAPLTSNLLAPLFEPTAKGITDTVILPAGAGTVIAGQDATQEIAPGLADEADGLTRDGGEA